MALLGVKELKGDFRKIGNALSSTLRLASYAAAQVVRDKAKEIAPRKTGRSLRFIAAARRRGSKTRGVAEVGYLKPAFNLAIIEVGAQGHAIVAHETTKLVNPRTRVKIGTRTKKKLVLVTKEGRWLGVAVWHRGFGAHPILVPALLQVQESLLRIMTDKFNAAIEGKL